MTERQRDREKGGKRGIQTEIEIEKLGLLISRRHRKRFVCLKERETYIIYVYKERDRQQKTTQKDRQAKFIECHEIISQMQPPMLYKIIPQASYQGVWPKNMIKQLTKKLYKKL